MAWPGCSGLPFGNFFLRVRTVFSALKTGLHGRIKARKALRVLATAALTLVLCGTAWGLLAAADANFAALGQSVADWWNSLLNNIKYIDTLMYIILSLPVGAWLYGWCSAHCAAPNRPRRWPNVPLRWNTPALCRAVRQR